MTLDISKYIRTLIDKEAMIQHLSVKVQVGKVDSLNSTLKQAILQKFGDTFLADANYIAIFKRPEGWEKNNKEQLFKLVNSALGDNANTLSKNDFQVIDIDNVDSTDEEALLNKNVRVFIKITIK